MVRQILIKSIPARERRTKMSCGNTMGPLSTIREPHGRFTRCIEFQPGYNCRAHKCKAGHGRHGMELRFYLMGNSGTTQLLVYTGFMPGQLQDAFLPLAADFGAHWKTPIFDGHEATSNSCDYIDTLEPCYYDGSGLRAGEVYTEFLVDGPEVVWERLEEFYDSLESEQP